MPIGWLTADTLVIFKACFAGLMHAYGTYDPMTGRVTVVRWPVTDDVLLRHLEGVQPYGVFLLVHDRVRAAAVDFDDDDPTPVLAFVDQAVGYGLRSYVERSKSKGWHVWCFFPPEGVPAFKVRLVLKAILNDIGKPRTELFPKQDRLAHRRQLGNFINVPMWGRMVPHGRTVFVDPRNHLRPYNDQWQLLACADRITERQLDEIMEINDLGPVAPVPAVVHNTGDETHPSRSYGLPPCAQRMLENGVEQYQRVSCFRLAIHLRRRRLTLNETIAALKDWAGKNRPRDGKRIITDEEITSQAAGAYKQLYPGCGCEDPAVAPFCDPGCPIARRVRKPG